jgi:hypothetical protein
MYSSAPASKALNFFYAGDASPAATQKDNGKRAGYPAGLTSQISGPDK